MFTDMTGYTSLMQKDEEKARELIERQRETVTPLVNKYGGKVLQYVGDGTFCSFESAIESVNCAIEIQKALIDQEQISLRIGIHVGDVVLKGEEVYGDGVNVASRLEPLAEPGGICISGRVYDDIRNQRNIEAVFLGEKNLKNVDRPIKVYALKGEALSTPKTESIPESQTHTERINRRRLSVIGSVLVTILIGSLVLYLNMNKMSPDSGVKMLVVLPFENLGPAENEYFADGMTEEITSRLASISGLGVISRTSAMQYKNVIKSAEQIGRELGVQYILEGTIRYQSVGDGKSRVRITPQLIRVSDDSHLWATTYDGFMEEIFELQTNIAEKVAAAMDITLLEPERRELKREHTKNLEAYDYYLRGNEYFYKGTDESYFVEAAKWYQKAVELDPTFSVAYARLSLAYTNRYWYGGSAKEYQIAAEKAVLEALRINPNLAEAHLAIGEFQNRIHQDYDEALEHFTIALKKQPNNADVYSAIALVQKRQGKWEESIKNYKRATMLDPLSPIKALEAGRTHLYMRNYLEAEKYIGRAKTLNPNSSDNYSNEAWLYLLSDGNKERAERVVHNAGTVDLNKIMAGAKSYLWGVGLWRFDLLNEEYDKSVNALTPGLFANDRLTYLLSKAQLYALMDEEKFQYSYYDSARMLLEELVRSSPKVFKLHSMLGFVCANLGLREQAIESGRRAVEIMPISLCHY
ncbi:MAG: tetratricopeptide repeat protein [Candidatus Marinimicrobia bacterium]|nr:tetratricopeptide repeat protein [Candidatus Neomarinimicrobiota bacterium]